MDYINKYIRTIKRYPYSNFKALQRRQLFGIQPIQDVLFVAHELQFVIFLIIYTELTTNELCPTVECHCYNNTHPWHITDIDMTQPGVVQGRTSNHDAYNTRFQVSKFWVAFGQLVVKTGFSFVLYVYNICVPPVCVFQLRGRCDESECRERHVANHY